MKRQKLFSFMLLAGAMSATAPAIHSQAVDSFGHPAWMSTPEPQLAPGADTTTSVDVRRARSEFFNSPAELQAHDLTRPDSAGFGSGQSSCYSRPQPLPIASSDAIITGTVNSTQPFLSTDHSKIYSELSFVPDEIIKDTSKTLISGQPAVIIGGGGSIKLPDGRAIASVAGGGSSPIDVGIRYLLFMHYVADAKAYTVSKAWDVSNEQPLELDLNGRPAHFVTSDSNYTTTRESLIALVKSRVEAK